MLDTQPLETKSFTGGLTDEPVAAAPSQFQRLDNVLLNREGDLISRPGSILYDVANAQLPSGNQRVSALINLNRDTDLFAVSGPNLYRYSAGWTAVTGPAGAALLGASVNSHPTACEWRKQLFLVNDEQTPPSRVYFDDTAAAYVARTAGLPFMAVANNFVPATALASLITLANDARTTLLAHFTESLATNITLANDLKAKWNAHVVDLTRHVIANSGVVVSAANATDTPSLVTLTAALVASLNAHLSDALLPAAWVYHYAKDITSSQYVANDTTSLPIAPTPTDLASCSIVLLAIQSTMNGHDSNLTTHHGAVNHQSSAPFAFAEHADQDAAALSILVAPAATDLVSLQTLTAQLLLAYDSHFNDSARSVPTVHRLAYFQNAHNGLTNARLTTTIAPLAYPDIANALNDLKIRYAIHWDTTDVHYNQVLGSPIGTGFVTGVTIGANTNLDISGIYTLANSLKQKINAHKARQGASTPHKTYGGYYLISAANATDYASLATLVTQLRQSMSEHIGNSESSAMHSGTLTDVVADLLLDPFFAGIGGTLNASVAPAGAYDLQLALLLEIVQKFNHHQASAGPHQGNLASVLAQGITITAVAEGQVGNSLAVTFISGGTAGSETVSVTGNSISVAIQSGTSTVTQVRTAINASTAAAALVTATGTSASTVSAFGTVSLFGGGGGGYPNLDPTPYNTIVLGSYLYSLHYFYQFVSRGVTFQIAGPVFQYLATKTPSFENQSNTIQNIPVLANSGNLNYDTTNIIVKIARTTNGGTQLYYAGQVTNGTTSFVDRMTDANLQLQPQIYTSGGILQSEPPPFAKYLHIVGPLAFYGNITDQGVSYPNRIRQSLPNTIDGCPGSYFIDLPQECVGISSARGTPIAWTKSKAFRLEGSFDLLGRGSIQAVAIQDSVGLLASTSPIQTNDGVIFAGTDGWYFTDGYQVKRVSKHWPTTYAGMTTATRTPLIRGDVDLKNQRIYWSISQNGTECDSALVLDLNFPLSENSVFTTWSNDVDFAPTAWCYFGGQMLRGDSRGYVFKHDPTYLTDPKVNTGAAASTWLKKWIRYDIRSIAHDFGSLMFRKWVPRITLKARNKGNLSVQINSINDDGRVAKALPAIRFRGVSQYLDPSIAVPTGAPALVSAAVIDERRRFPAGTLRCSNKQIQITSAKVGITNSDTLGLASVNGSTKVVTLAAGTFPADLSDQVIAFAGDGFVTEWAILSQVGGTVTVSDPGATLPNLINSKWVVRGYPKDEQLQLLSYVLHYAMLGKEQKTAAGESGEDA